MARRRRIAYYDPDPDPFPFTLILIGVMALAGIGLWTNPNALNNLMMMMKPELMKLEEERLKTQLESLRYIVLIAALCLGAIVILWFLTRKKAKIRTRYFAYGARAL